MKATPPTRVICPQCGAQVLEEANFCGMCGTSLVGLAAQSDPYMGETVAGRYRIQSRLATGGMGEVYIAEHETLNQRVAVKLLHRRFATDEQIVARFFNEARSYCRVKHPHAVSVLDFGRLTDGTLYIVTEFIDGKPLRQLVEEEGPLAPGQAVRLGIQLSEALAAAHSEQIVHRDLKPDNIMVTAGPGGRFMVKVLDFGIAKILDDSEQPPLTKVGAIFGTPEFMSPEQAQGLPVSFATDLYSLGCVLFYMLTGSAPFEGRNGADVIQKQIGQAAPLDRLREQPRIPSQVIALVADLLEKEPENRPADMLETLHRLEALATQVPEPSPSVDEPLAVSSDLDLDVPLEREGSATPRRVLETPLPSEGDPLTGAVEEPDAEAGGFEVDLGEEPFEAEEEYRWGDEAEGRKDPSPLGRALDIASGEIPVTALKGESNLLAWLVAALALAALGTGGFFYLTNRGDAHSPAHNSPPAPTVPAVASGTGAGTGLAMARPPRATPGPTRQRRASAVPERAFVIVMGAREVARAAVLLEEADVDGAAQAYNGARALLELPEGDGADLSLVTNLTRAQDLVQTARRALGDGQCRQADRAIVEMREISPALRRSFLSDLNDCNRRQRRRDGRPPPTLE